MTELVLLDTAEIQQYVTGLNLVANSENARTISALLALGSSSTFTRVMSALSAGLITLSDIRTLPAISTQLVEQLIQSRVGANSLTTLAYRYKNEWFPDNAGTTLVKLKAQAQGPSPHLVYTNTPARWNLIISPSYDFLKTDPTKFFTYAEALNAYMSYAGSEAALEAVSDLVSVGDNLGATAKSVIANNAVLDAVTSVTTKPIFLERSVGGLETSLPLIDFILGEKYLYVRPENFRSIMDAAYLAMAQAAGSDPLHTGESTVASLRSSSTWLPLDASNPSLNLDTTRMHRVVLPSVFGIDTSADQLVENELVVYFDTARSILVEIRNLCAQINSNSAAIYR